MALDLKDDYKVFDGLQNVTLDGAPVTDAYALDIVDTEGAPSEGVYLHTDVEFQIRTTAGVVPQIGQVIVDGAGRSFNILAVRQPFANDYYGCICREVTIVAGLALANKITRYPAIVSVDEEGSRIVDNSTADPAFTDVPAKIQDVSAEHADFMGKRGFDRLFHIYVDSEIDLNHGDVLKDEHLIIYDVLSWENRDRIDVLSMIVAHIRN